MLTAFIIVLVAVVCLCVGFYARELKERLKRIEMALKLIVERQKKEEQKEKKMGFATPMSMEQFEEMEENARIESLNQ